MKLSPKIAVMVDLFRQCKKLKITGAYQIQDYAFKYRKYDVLTLKDFLLMGNCIKEYYGV